MTRICRSVAGWMLLAVSAAAQRLEVLHEFRTDGPRPFTGSKGAHPSSGVTLGSDGNFYGTTSHGGDLTLGEGVGWGVFYRISKEGEFAVLGTFSAGTPNAKFTEGRDGYFYGVLDAAAPPNNGGLYKVSKDGVITHLPRFNGLNGSDARGQLLQARDGDFYGTAYQGGVNNGGTIYRLTQAGELTTVVDFGATPGVGIRPESGLIEDPNVDGVFYGTMEQGPAFDDGAVYRVTAAGEVTVLGRFNRKRAEEGFWPHAALTFGADGKLYGTTPNGGTAFEGSQGPGTAFRVSATGGDLTTIARFDFAEIGGGVRGQLINGGNGLFYGMTSYGSAGSERGTVFQMSPDGRVRKLISLGGPAGTPPATASLTLGPDGNLYGTMANGGTDDLGFVFRVVMPRLETRAVSSEELSVSWPSNQMGFKLDVTGDLKDGQWTESQDLVGLNGEFFTITNRMESALFYRLRKD